jgi:hypothetical protein
MNAGQKSEVLYRVTQEIAFGFASNDEILEMAEEALEDPEDFDEEWAKNEIQMQAAQRLANSKTWKTPTDFQRLTSAFDTLVSDQIIAMHFAGYTREDAEGDAAQVFHALKANGIVAKGYCYYHEQDLEHVIEPDGGELYVGYGAYTDQEGDEARIGQIVATRLGAAGFTLDWNGSGDERIRVLDIVWQKLPDDQVWDGNRALKQFVKQKSQANSKNSQSARAQASTPKPSDKPWWKFWG